MKTIGKMTVLVLLLGGLATHAWAVCQPVSRAPEIDPGLAVSTVSVLLGGLMILRDRRRG